MKQPTPDVDVPFRIGDRVQLSELGRERGRKMNTKLGTVIGFAKFSSGVNVHFDERKTPMRLHFSYLELADEAGRLRELALKAKK